MENVFAPLAPHQLQGRGQVVKPNRLRAQTVKGIFLCLDQAQSREDGPPVSSPDPSDYQRLGEDLPGEPAGERWFAAMPGCENDGAAFPGGLYR